MRRLTLILSLVLLAMSPAGSTAQISQSQRDAFGKLLEAAVELKCPKCAVQVVVSGTEVTTHMPQASAQQFNEESSAVQAPHYFDVFRGFGFTKYVVTNDKELTLIREISASGPEAAIVPVAAPPTATASPQPFGFSESLTEQKIRALIGADAVKKIDGDVMTVTTAPKPNSFFDEYMLVVTPKEGLVKVLAIGKTIQTGDSGAELRSNFQEVVEAVSQKYGAPTQSFDFCNGGTGCDSSEYWMLSLNEKNRTLAAAWDSEQIMVETNALGMNSGYVTFSMEFPSFSAYAARKKAKQNDTF